MNPSKHMSELFTQLGGRSLTLLLQSFSFSNRTFEVTISTLKMGTAMEPTFHIQKQSRALAYRLNELPANLKPLNHSWNEVTPATGFLKNVIHSLV